MRQERENRMWREIGALLDSVVKPSTHAAQRAPDEAGQRAAESIRQAAERDHALYETYLHDFSDGRDVS